MRRAKRAASGSPPRSPRVTGRATDRAPVSIASRPCPAASEATSAVCGRLHVPEVARILGELLAAECALALLAEDGDGMHAWPVFGTADWLVHRQPACSYLERRRMGPGEGGARKRGGSEGGGSEDTDPEPCVDDEGSTCGDVEGDGSARGRSKSSALLGRWKMSARDTLCCMSLHRVGPSLLLQTSCSGSMGLVRILGDELAFDATYETQEYGLTRGLPLVESADVVFLVSKADKQGLTYTGPGLLLRAYRVVRADLAGFARPTDSSGPARPTKTAGSARLTAAAASARPLKEEACDVRNPCALENAGRTFIPLRRSPWFGDRRLRAVCWDLRDGLAPSLYLYAVLTENDNGRGGRL